MRIDVGIETDMGKLIEKIDEYRPDQVPEIQAMQKSLKTAMLKKNFSEHPALSLLLSTLRKREKSYTLIISDKEDIDVVQRASYFARRAEVRFILSFFDVDSSIDTIERRVKAELEEALSEDVKVEE